MLLLTCLLMLIRHSMSFWLSTNAMHCNLLPEQLISEELKDNQPRSRFLTCSRGKEGELRKVQRSQEDANKRREHMAAAAEARMAALRLASEQQKLWLVLNLSCPSQVPSACIDHYNQPTSSLKDTAALQYALFPHCFKALG